MHKLLVFALALQLVSVSFSRADEASMCAESGLDVYGSYYECLEYLEERLIVRYPAIAERSGSSLTLIASNSNSNRTVEDLRSENGHYYLIAHFPEYALSIVKQTGHEWSTRHVFLHRSGQFIKVSGWPAFSDDGTVIVFLAPAIP